VREKLLYNFFAATLVELTCTNLEIQLVVPFTLMEYKTHFSLLTFYPQMSSSNILKSMLVQDGEGASADL
jgi:hypothetical protein